MMSFPSDSDQGTAKAIAEFKPWFHNLHLPDGSQTAPDHDLGDFPANKWRLLEPCLPKDLEGWTALDAGCNAGFYSFELAKRGARVTAVDVNAHYLRQARWAADRFGLADKIHFRQMHVYELARLNGDAFDLVVFLGLFYHLRYPLLALDVLARKTKRLMVFQTLSMPGEETAAEIPDFGLGDREVFLHPGWPKMAFIEEKLSGDPTNWWAPNHACVLAMLRSSGLRVVRHPAHEMYLCKPSGRSSWVDEFISYELEAAAGSGGD